ncbi:probable E3 ubiquitin-protein ligase ZFP1 [Cornus florida]|uniref:probable E3 ubiquitin-protein ligase ZFP1 n=1 Tax=Cornus florida TaxID=4283 RepID=UPI0028995233|nr:probable E3 ubiquitin-protein ligase ZFP1 [Cornus florida]XP_059667654.1 probable E3 ubiquitin-protein ligase ZFP1 [Cornus florida]XP_059667655.1 probable E3 ubiquitin-protein ligase ZFP1 [Cornus florida]XP_059667656.1 probable E3 ubiquitin-protein ligase ZFP1 [Cornus florida]XP_059667658.1 probable E3 ubiquitin-protein ligase ZFP1 [Cornus florida]XP_059667659.1 probable E3 ubiquitin-protein ligase ZFP1 [Cornus florida]XP_059667660.1 probable E3 ubiquitin-protein ligase ZFP1 [Cornus florid
MGHRHVFSSSQMFETDNDQSWNHLQVEQPYMHLAGSGAAENSSLVYPVENMSIDGVHFAPHWNPAPRSNDYPSSSHSVEVPLYQPDASALSRDPFLHPSTAGSFCTVPENYVHHASSSNYGGQTFHGVEGGFVDLAMGNGRGPYKRKSPGVPTVCERGSTSRSYNAGSSSDLSLSSDIWQEKPNPDFHHTRWDCPSIGPGYRGNGLSIAGEGTARNVRSRGAIDLETNLARTHLSSNPPHHPCSSRSTDHASSVVLLGQNSNASTHEWDHIHMPPAAHGRTVSDHFIIGSSNSSVPIDIGGYHNDFISSRNPVPRNFQGTSTQTVRGVRSSYAQRSTPPFRASSSNLRLGNAATSDEGLQLVTESYSSRQPRPFSTIGWRSGDRSGRARMSSERYRSLSYESGVRDRLASEGLMIVDRSALYGSRNLFDQHREMRLDVDNMSYEELLALGERIGNVNTGVSEDLLSRCLTESIYCSSDEFQEEGKCVICLEEYNNMDDVGTMKTCGHDFHVGCIRKWLSLKNSCPICKASAVSDNMKEK